MRKMIQATAVLAVVSVVLIGTWLSLAPKTGPAFYRFETGETGQKDLPLLVPSNGTFINTEFTLHLGLLHPTQFIVVPDDCLEQLIINGRPVEMPGVIPFCDAQRGKQLNLSTYVQAGDNTISAQVRDYGGAGGIMMRVSGTDPLAIMFVLLLLAAFGFYGWFVVHHLKGKNLEAGLVGALMTGVVIRLIYVFLTPYTLRAHDVDGHIEYIKFMAEHIFALPDPTAGWQFYQPPLYYFFGGLLWRLGSLFGYAGIQQLELIQWFSFFLSIIALGLVAWIATMLFKGKAKTWERFLFTFAFAVFPGIIFTAARINNDILYHVLTVAGFALLLHFWQTRTWKSWISLCVICGLLVITKTNGLLFVAAAFLSLPFVPKMRWRKTVALAAAGLGIIAVIGGWYPAMRYVAMRERPAAQLVVGNLGNLNGGLSVKNTWDTAVVFNPGAVIVRPFNNAWDDASRRQYFWEFFFRSALFGEYDFGENLKPFGSLLVFLWLLTIPVAIAGCITHAMWRRRVTVPMLFTFLVLMAGHVAFKFKAPFAPIQDFRYSSLVLLPFLFYVIVACDVESKTWRWYVRCLVLFASLSALEFIIMLLWTTT